MVFHISIVEEWEKLEHPYIVGMSTLKSLAVSTEPETCWQYKIKDFYSQVYIQPEKHKYVHQRPLKYVHEVLFLYQIKYSWPILVSEYTT